MFLTEFYSNLRSSCSYIKYRDLVKGNEIFKNSEKGNSCFIIGSGPSLLKHDLSKIQSTSIITINNLYDYNGDILNGIHKNNKSYHIVAPIHPPQKNEVWVTWLKDIEEKLPINTSLFLGLNVYRHNAFELSKAHGIFLNRNINWYFSGVEFNPGKANIKHANFSGKIYKAEAGSLYALMLAAYLGFDNIYLLGMDHDYFLYDNEEDMRVYKNSKHEGDGIYSQFDSDFYTEELFRQYKIFLKYHAIKKLTKSNIYNCTEGGILKVFKRLRFTDVLKKD
ncbi:hypothetical protein AB5G97_07415 [Aeromonas veronii]|uniref:hypothetical protein n=1 Tax=Aeromonas veronii TaxID=654 RepID=UPI00366ACE97